MTKIRSIHGNGIRRGVVLALSGLQDGRGGVRGIGERAPAIARRFCSVYSSKPSVYDHRQNFTFVILCAFYELPATKLITGDLLFLLSTFADCCLTTKKKESVRKIDFGDSVMCERTDAKM